MGTEVKYGTAAGGQTYKEKTTTGTWQNNIHVIIAKVDKPGSATYEAFEKYENDLKKNTSEKVSENSQSIIKPSNTKPAKDIPEGYTDLNKASNTERSEYTGDGVFKDSYGDIYQGEWKNGKRHGRGILTYHDGAQLHGVWKKDEFKRVTKNKKVFSYRP